MVELSGKDDPFQHGFPNVVFILPAIIVAGLSGEYHFCVRCYKCDPSVIKWAPIARNENCSEISARTGINAMCHVCYSIR